MSSYRDYEPRPNTRETQLIARVSLALVHIPAAMFLGFAMWNEFWIEPYYLPDVIYEFAPVICLYGSWGFVLGQISIVTVLVALVRVFPPIKVGVAMFTVALLFDAYLIVPTLNGRYLANWQLPDDYIGLQVLGQICLAVTLAGALMVNGWMKTRLPGRSLLARRRTSLWQLNIRDVLLTTVVVAIFVGVTRQRFADIRAFLQDIDPWVLCLPVIHLAVAGPMAAYVGFSALLGRRIRWRLLLLLVICFAQLAMVFNLYRDYLPYYSRDIVDIYVTQGLSCCAITSTHLLTVYCNLKCLRSLGVEAVPAGAAESSSPGA